MKMQPGFIVLTVFLLSLTSSFATDKTNNISSVTKKEQKMTSENKNPIVEIETSAGTIKVELWADKAPLTVKNFLKYVDEGFYNGTIFHRVIKNFMIQGGGFTADMQRKSTHAPVKNEAKADVKNDRGTIAMARTSVVDSATSQFFINLVDNGFLNHKNETAQGYGYCVFGKVVDGMDVVDKIGAAQTGINHGMRDVPKETITIKSIKISDK